MSIWPDDLASLASHLRERGVALGAQLEYRAQTASTNDDAKLGARNGAAHGTVWIADHQQSGRGRQGRSWSSPAGDNVLLSLLVRGRFSPRRVPLAGLVAGLAARHAIAAALPGKSVRLKWPNDVQLLCPAGARRKMAGVLVEAQSRGAALESLVIGIGINVHTTQFPAALRESASSIALQGGIADRALLIADLLQYLDRHLATVLERGLGSLHAELERHDALLGERVESDAGSGLAEGIDQDGRLLVRDAHRNIHAWSFGEVHLAKVTPSDPPDPLPWLLRPAGGGVFLVSTGRAEQLALQRMIYAVDRDEDVKASHQAALAKVAGAKAIVLGIPSDVGAGFRRGANLGPQELRRTFYAQYPEAAAWSERSGVVDVGDVFVVPQLLHDEMLSPTQLEATREAVFADAPAEVRKHLPVSPLSMAERVLDRLLAINPELRVLVLGGDHSTAWPVVSSLHRRDPDLCILQFDAHTDLLQDRLGVKYCFATWSYHANDMIGRGGRMVQVGIRATRHQRGHWEDSLGVRQFWAEECVRDPAGAKEKILDHLAAVGCKRLYISNDVDGTDERWASATGTPESGGLTPDFVEGLIEAAGKRFTVVGGDVMEVAPSVAAPEGGLAETLRLGARYLRATFQAALGSAP